MSDGKTTDAELKRAVQGKQNAMGVASAAALITADDEPAKVPES